MILRSLSRTQMNICLEKLVFRGKNWFPQGFCGSSQAGQFLLLKLFHSYGQKFHRSSVPLATCSLMTCYLQNKVTRFQNWKGRKGMWAVTQPITDRPDNRMSADKRRTVFLKGRCLFPPWTRKKRTVGINTMCVSFGRVTGRWWPYTSWEGV